MEVHYKRKGFLDLPSVRKKKGIKIEEKLYQTLPAIGLDAVIVDCVLILDLLFTFIVFA